MLTTCACQACRTLALRVAQVRPAFQRSASAPAVFTCVVQFQPDDAVHRRFAATVHIQVKVSGIALLIATFQCVTQFYTRIWRNLQSFARFESLRPFAAELQVLLFHVGISRFVRVAKCNRAAAVKVVNVVTQGVIPVHAVIERHLMFQAKELAITACNAIITRFLRTITIETSDTVLQTHRLAFAQVDSFTQCQHVVFGIIT